MLYCQSGAHAMRYWMDAGACLAIGDVAFVTLSIRCADSSEYRGTTMTGVATVPDQPFVCIYCLSRAQLAFRRSDEFMAHALTLTECVTELLL